MPGARDASIAALAKKAVEDAVRISALFATLGVNVPMSVNMPLDILGELKLGEFWQSPSPTRRAWPGLIVDLHEKSVIHDMPVAIEVAQTLAPHNVKLALDDFGNGYNARCQDRDVAVRGDQDRPRVRHQLLDRQVEGRDLQERDRARA